MSKLLLNRSWLFVILFEHLTGNLKNAGSGFPSILETLVTLTLSHCRYSMLLTGLAGSFEKYSMSQHVFKIFFRPNTYTPSTSANHFSFSQSTSSKYLAKLTSTYPNLVSRSFLRLSDDSRTNFLRSTPANICMPAGRVNRVNDHDFSSLVPRHRDTVQMFFFFSFAE